MARPNQDPFESLIADGRVVTRPLPHYGTSTVLDVNLDVMCTILRDAMHRTLNFYAPLRAQYTGSEVNVTNTINQDINAMIDFALFVCYNRLRSVAERYSQVTRTTRLNTRAPVSNRMEFPAFLSSLLGSIGPLRITDGPHDMMVIYATTANCMNYYGRAAQQIPVEGHYTRLTAAMTRAGIRLAPIDLNAMTGSAWTTIEVTGGDYLYSYISTLHPSHYENEDVARAFIMGTPAEARNPFQMICMTVGYVDDAATTAALAAVAPANLPAGVTANAPGRPVYISYNVNFYGIRPAFTPAGATAETPRGIYVIGRGSDRAFASTLADEISAIEISEALRFRFTAP